MYGLLQASTYLLFFAAGGALVCLCFKAREECGCDYKVKLFSQAVREALGERLPDGCQSSSNFSACLEVFGHVLLLDDTVDLKTLQRASARALTEVYLQESFFPDYFEFRSEKCRDCLGGWARRREDRRRAQLVRAIEDSLCHLRRKDMELRRLFGGPSEKIDLPNHAYIGFRHATCLPASVVEGSF